MATDEHDHSIDKIKLSIMKNGETTFGFGTTRFHRNDFATKTCKSMTSQSNTSDLCERRTVLTLILKEATDKNFRRTFSVNAVKC